MWTTFVRLGAINAFLAVALGAFGAHGLRDKIAPRLLETYETGAHYHLIHAVALLVVGLLAERLATDTRATRLTRVAGTLFTVGIVLFSGSLYVLAVTDIRPLGAITPFGGVCFLTGWALLVAAVSRRTPPAE